VPSGFLDYPRPLAFAHRGGASHFPENSWKAFEHAVGLGYAYLETDVHATADGTVIAFHDKTLDRVTDGTGTIAQLTAAQVATARIGGREPIPLLAELLASWPEHRFNIDVKDEPVIGPLVQVLRAANAWDRVCITSFSGRRLSATRALLPRPVCMATPPGAVSAIAAGTPAGLLTARFGRLSIRCAQIPVRVATGQFIRRAHAAGLQVHVWTINDPAVMTSLLDRGADGLMTDQAETLRDVLAGRGQWHPQHRGTAIPEP
jgi:glycerophosphoryl diester phosphodiesterase